MYVFILCKVRKNCKKKKIEEEGKIPDSTVKLRPPSKVASGHDNFSDVIDYRHVFNEFGVDSKSNELTKEAKKKKQKRKNK